MTKVGIIFDVRRDPPFESVSKLWDATVAALGRRFEIRVHTVDSFDVEGTPAFRAFVNDVDVLVALSPYYAIDREIADRPLVVYALGSLAKGGHWLRHNARSFRATDTLVVSSTRCAKILGAIAKTPVMPVRRVPFGVDPDVYRPRDRATLRASLGLPRGRRILLYSGRISPQKNCALVLEVFREMLRRHDDLHLVFVGRHDDFVVPELQVHPSDRETFERLRASLGERVTSLPHRDDPVAHAETIAAADVGLNFTTALGENYGFTQVEYQLCGLPVVCTDYGGLHDTVDDGRTGYRVPTTLTEHGVRVDVDAALDRLDRLLSDPAVMDTMGARARPHALAFSNAAFEEALARVVAETATRVCLRAPLDVPLAPEMERLHERLLEQFGTPRGVDHEHLHPGLDFASYALVVSQIVTRDETSGSSTRDTFVPRGLRRST